MSAIVPCPIMPIDDLKCQHFFKYVLLFTVIPPPPFAPLLLFLLWQHKSTMLHCWSTASCAHSLKKNVKREQRIFKKILCAVSLANRPPSHPEYDLQLLKKTFEANFSIWSNRLASVKLSSIQSNYVTLNQTVSIQSNLLTPNHLTFIQTTRPSIQSNRLAPSQII